MKILKKIGLGLLILIALPFIVALFIDGKYDVVREATINQSNEVVFEYLKYLKNQDSFSVWAKMDPNMKKGLEGIDGTVGAIASWESDNEKVGKGEQEIIKITEGERIDFELRFFKPFESKDNAYFTTEPVNDNQTKVQWGFDGNMSYPKNLMLLFFDFEKELAPALEEGLTKLKEIMESSNAESVIEITEEEVTAKTILFIPDSATLQMDVISKKMGDAYGEMMSFIQKNKLEMLGVPMAITNEFSLEKMFYNFDAAIPVNEITTEPTGRIKLGTSYGGKVVKAVYVGPYEASMPTYDAIIKYIQENKLDTNGRSWEEYMNDPREVSPEELRTHIYFPIK